MNNVSWMEMRHNPISPKKSGCIGVFNIEKGLESQVALANGQYHDRGMWIAPHAVMDDGWFNITVLGNFTLIEVLRHLLKLYNGTHLKLNKAKTYRAEKVMAYSDQRVLLDVDGEQPGTLPVTIEMVPKAISIIAPIY